MKGFPLRLLRKLLAGIVMIWVVATFTFFLVRLIPGTRPRRRSKP
jgi:peptide/nickel transport system permease protein